MTKEQKKYRGYTRARRVFIVLAVAFCLIPVVFAALFIVPKYKDATGAVTFCGGTAALLGIVAFIFKMIVKNSASKTPHALTVFISAVLVFLLVLGARGLLSTITGTLAEIETSATRLFLKLYDVLEDSFGYLIIQILGAAVGLIFELAGRYCTEMIEEIKLFRKEVADNE
jgi:ABC-type polysaccharide/polyol phosphate export permease